MIKFNLIVIKTNQLETLKAQYEVLGFQFIKHKHGNGPLHYSADINGLIFEIYPLPKSKAEVDNTTRLGFVIEDIKAKQVELEESNWLIHSELRSSEWGMRMVIQDLDGRKIELIEKRD